MIDQSYQVEEAVTDAASVPQNREAEESVLGAVLISPAEVWPLVRYLKTEEFYIHRHKWIWDVYIKLQTQNISIDTLTVTDELDKRGQLAEIGGSAFLTRLISRVPNLFNAESHARIIRDRATRRAMIADANRLATDAYDMSKSIAPSLIMDPSEYSTWADINAGPIEYSWQGWLANGLLTLLVSYSGDGKSLLTLRVCGPFINGQCFPDGTPYKGKKGSVLWVECEAAQAINVLRANVFKYPLDKIITPLSNPLEDVSLDNAEHRAIVEQRAALPEVKFIVIDSLSGSSQRKENETGIKEITLWAAKLARDLNKPILMVHHLGKKKEWDNEIITLDRVRGSSAIVQFARIVWAVSCPDSTNRERKRLEQIKNNLGRFPEAIGMTATENGIDFGIAPTVPHVDSPSERLRDLLMDLLSSAPVKATEIEQEIEGAGESMVTAKRVKKALGIVSVKKDDGWYWSLPAMEKRYA